MIQASCLVFACSVLVVRPLQAVHRGAHPCFEPGLHRIHGLPLHRQNRLLLRIATLGVDVRFHPDEALFAAQARLISHEGDWLRACKGGKPASSDFNYGGALTEMALLGMIAIRVKDQNLEWDPVKLQFKNNQEANDLLHIDYRGGWKL